MMILKRNFLIFFLQKLVYVKSFIGEKYVYRYVNKVEMQLVQDDQFVCIGVEFFVKVFFNIFIVNKGFVFLSF